MAKKKTIDLRSVDPTPVPAGDVNIIYNGTRIGGFSEDTEATLKTGGTRVEHDINVNYTKPSGGISLPEVNLTNTPGANIYAETGALLSKINDIIVANYKPSYEKLYIVPVFDQREQTYGFEILVESEEDTLNVNVNNTPVLFDNDGYTYTYSSATYPEELSIVITNKE